MNTTLMLNWTERAGFLLLAWHGLALTVSLLAWVTVSGLRRRSCVARSWIARAALVVAVLAPLLGLAVNSLPKKTAAAQTLTVSGGGESAFAAVDWDKIAVWKPLMARVDFAAVELPEKNGGLTVSGRQLGLSLFALLVTALLVRGAICFALAWRGKNRLLNAARRAEAGQFAACREVAALTLTKLPELRFSASVSGPMLAGVFKPVLLLPDESFAREPVLLHEFTHLRRRDTLWQTLALTLRLCAPLQFGFALLQRAMRQADEEVCDDAVIARGADRGAYATLLLDMAERKHLRGEFVLSMAAVSQLERRVRRLLDAARSPIGKVPAAWLALVALVALTLTALGGWVCADVAENLKPEIRNVENNAAADTQPPAPSPSAAEKKSSAAIIREINVDYAGPVTMPREQVISWSGLTVGGKCEESNIGWAVKHLYQTRQFRNLRIFTERADADGQVKVTIVVQPLYKLRQIIYQGISERQARDAFGMYFEVNYGEGMAIRDEKLFDLRGMIERKTGGSVRVFWSNENNAEGLADMTISGE